MGAIIYQFPGEEERFRRKCEREANDVGRAHAIIGDATMQQSKLIEMAASAVVQQVNMPRIGNRIPMLSFGVLPTKRNAISIESHANPLNTRVEDMVVRISPDFMVPVQPKSRSDGLEGIRLAAPLYMVTFGLAKFAYKYMSRTPHDSSFDEELWRQTASTPVSDWARAHHATAAVVLHYYDFDPCTYSSTVAITPGSLSPHMASMHNPMSLVDAHAFFGDSSL